jgi:5-oxoprolinase (ATP-hydrolysing) subunit A
LPGTIDLNSDMGESFGLYRHGADEEILPHISSANIACGFHAGDPTVMRRTVALAQRHGVAVGAHVGFPDLLGFGRRHLGVKPVHLKDYVTYQIGALQAFLRAAGFSLHHVKPHGALYMMALEDEAISRAIIEASLEAANDLIIYTIKGSATDDAARKCGMRSVAEFFADRGYYTDGRVKMFDWTLDEAGGTPENIGQRIVTLLRQGTVAALDGGEAKVSAETICVHSDTPGAPQIALAIRQALQKANIDVCPPSHNQPD